MQVLVRSLVAAHLLWSTTSILAANGELEIRFVEDATGEPVAAQLEIRDRRGRVRKIRRTPSWQGWAAIDGRVIVELPPGKYTFSVDRGPEYLEQTGHFLIRTSATDNKTIRIRRFTDLSKQGWWSADLSVSRPLRDLDLWMRSADLHLASGQSWTFDGQWSPPSGVDFDTKWNRNGDHLFNLAAGGDDRWGGRSVVFGAQPMVVATATAKSPSSIEFLKHAHRNENAHVCATQANAWDLPIWLASGYLDSFTLLGPELRPEAKRAKDPTGLPRDHTFYPAPHGWAHWAQDIYYHILNSGLRLPPVAASGSGINTNPMGYCRTYVHCGEDIEAANWWEQLRLGRVIVTNGPLMIPKVSGELPGHVFRGYAGETVSLSTELTLHTRVKIEYLEIIKNGKVHDDIMLSDLVDKQGVLPNVDFTESGWFLIRAVTSSPVYHAVSTGPYYVQFDDQPRISRKSAQFFLDWLKRRSAELDTVDRYHRAAEKYWQELADKATVE